MPRRQGRDVSPGERCGRKRIRVVAVGRVAGVPGIFKVRRQFIDDRRRAISLALDAAKSGDSLLIAGKGHEPFQELAGRTISAMALIGLGYRSISMSPASIGPVKAMLNELPLAELEAFLDDALARPGLGRDMRAELTAFADKHNVPL